MRRNRTRVQSRKDNRLWLACLRKPWAFSDLDLLIVMPYEGSPLQQAARIITRVNPKFGVDVIVRTPAQIRERLALQDGFMREIVERGRVAYEADHA
jgi:hypothetical protein